MSASTHRIGCIGDLLVVRSGRAPVVGLVAHKVEAVDYGDEQGADASPASASIKEVGFFDRFVVNRFRFVFQGDCCFFHHVTR